MNTTLEQKINFLGKNNFVKFTNCGEFPELSVETKDFLENTGIYSYEKGYPYVTASNRLIRLEHGLVQFGTTFMGSAICIDPSDGEKIKGYSFESKSTDIINSSIKKYIECLYALQFFSKEYELKDKFGSTSEINNSRKYAAKLKELFEEVEPDIMNFPTWGVQVYEREMGVL